MCSCSFLWIQITLAAFGIIITFLLAWQFIQVFGLEKKIRKEVDRKIDNELGNIKLDYNGFSHFLMGRLFELKLNYYKALECYQTAHTLFVQCTNDAMSKKCEGKHW